MVILVRMRSRNPAQHPKKGKAGGFPQDVEQGHVGHGHAPRVEFFMMRPDAFLEHDRPKGIGSLEGRLDDNDGERHP